MGPRPRPPALRFAPERPQAPNPRARSGTRPGPGKQRQTQAGACACAPLATASFRGPCVRASRPLLSRVAQSHKRRGLAPPWARAAPRSRPGIPALTARRPGGRMPLHGQWARLPAGPGRPSLADGDRSRRSQPRPETPQARPETPSRHTPEPASIEPRSRPWLRDYMPSLAAVRGVLPLPEPIPGLGCAPIQGLPRPSLAVLRRIPAPPRARPWGVLRAHPGLGLAVPGIVPAHPSASPEPIPGKVPALQAPHRGPPWQLPGAPSTSARPSLAVARRILPPCPGRPWQCPGRSQRPGPRDPSIPPRTQGHHPWYHCAPSLAHRAPSLANLTGRPWPRMWPSLARQRSIPASRGPSMAGRSPSLAGRQIPPRPPGNRSASSANLRDAPPCSRLRSARLRRPFPSGPPSLEDLGGVPPT